MSKIFEKLLCKQLVVFADQNFSWYQCDFRKGFSGQYSLVAMMARWKGGADDGKVFASLLNDLSKAFDCLSHKLIIGKLHA